MRIRGIYDVLYMAINIIQLKLDSPEITDILVHEKYSSRFTSREGSCTEAALCYMFYSIQYQTIHAHEAKENRRGLPKSSHYEGTIGSVFGICSTLK